MEKALLKFGLYQLRIVGTLLITILLTTFLVSFRSNKIYLDLWQQLGISEKDGITGIRESFINGYLQYYGAHNIKNIAAGDHTAVVKDLLGYTKTYVQGNEFKTAYQQLRKQRTPNEPKQPETEQEIRQKNINSVKESLANVEKALKSATPENKKMFQESYDMLQKQLKDYQDPDNELIKLMVQGQKTQYEFQLNDYREQLKKWQTDYPENPSLFIKRRLQQMLNATADVDYSAALTEKNGKKYFVKPEYEHKPSNWKYAFRAGKDVTETARAFARQWMAELN
jgi:hypothetical protein